MSVVQKIDDIYTLYCYSGQNITETLKVTNIKRPTLLRYIKIKERLDPSLFECLDKKGGRPKLTLEMALYICRNVLNPEYQHHIFKSIRVSSRTQMIQRIGELSECLICADQSSNFELTPCCGQFLCEGCLVHIGENAIEDITFKAINCPFCQQSFTLNEVKTLLIRRYARTDPSELWRMTGDYDKSLTLNYTYARNLCRKFMAILGKIERLRGHTQPDDRMPRYSRNYEEVIGKDLYYGCCTACSPDMSRTQRVDYRRIRIASVEKQCVMGENELAVLEPGQFLCTVCKSYQEDREDGTFKKCPHCGTRTLKPEGCNYVRCGDHRWCFICEERLENNHNGHNVHYHTGLPGASPYESSCRVSLKQDKPTFVLKTCDCPACKEHRGAPLCRELECMNRTSPNNVSFNDQCDECNDKRQKDIIYEGKITQGLLINYYSHSGNLSDEISSELSEEHRLLIETRKADQRRRYVSEPYLGHVYYGLHRGSPMRCFNGVVRMKRVSRYFGACCAADTEGKT